MKNLEALKTQVTNHETNQELASQLEKTASGLRNTLDRKELKELVHKVFWSEFAPRLKDQVWELSKHSGGDYPFATNSLKIITSSNEGDNEFLEAVGLVLGNWSTTLILEGDCFRASGKLNSWHPNGRALYISLHFKSFDDLQDAIRVEGLTMDWTLADKKYTRTFDAAKAEWDRANEKYSRVSGELHDWVAFKQLIMACCPEKIKEVSK